MPVDLQNPWLTGGGSPPPATTTTPTVPAGGPYPWTPGAKIDDGFHLNPYEQEDSIKKILDPAKYQSWTKDQWRLATTYGSYRPGGILQQLVGLMGQAPLNDHINTFQVGGAGYIPGQYNFKDNKWSWEQPGMNTPLGQVNSSLHPVTEYNQEMINSANMGGLSKGDYAGRSYIDPLGNMSAASQTAPAAYNPNGSPVKPVNPTPGAGLNPPQNYHGKAPNGAHSTANGNPINPGPLGGGTRVAPPPTISTTGTLPNGSPAPAVRVDPFKLNNPWVRNRPNKFMW
jgi:hypothetical protein